jgi:histone H3/H4
MIINKSKVKEETELSVSEEFLQELDKGVLEMIKRAQKRAKQNGRRTLFGRDV